MAPLYFTDVSVRLRSSGDVDRRSARQLFAGRDDGGAQVFVVVDPKKQLTGPPRKGDHESHGRFIQRRFPTLGAFSLAINADVMIVAQGSNP
jgi:hypothetical protein